MTTAVQHWGVFLLPPCTTEFYPSQRPSAVAAVMITRRVAAAAVTAGGGGVTSSSAASLPRAWCYDIVSAQL